MNVVANTNPRLCPSRKQFDYIVLNDLKRKITEHADEIGGRVLDYGCGSKPYAPLFGRSNEYLGADFSTNLQADIFLTSDGLLPTDIGCFDVIVSFQVMEHVPNVATYLNQCRRVLRKGRGKLLLTTHGVWPYHPGPGDFYRWTHEGLGHLLVESGFRVTRIEPITTGTRSMLQLAMCQLEQKGRLPFCARSTIYCLLNTLADCVGASGAIEQRLYNLPLCYLCIGEC